MDNWLALVERSLHYHPYDGNGRARQTVDEHGRPHLCVDILTEGAVLLGEQGFVTHLSCNGRRELGSSTNHKVVTKHGSQ